MWPRATRKAALQKKTPGTRAEYLVRLREGGADARHMKKCVSPPLRSFVSTPPLLAGRDIGELAVNLNINLAYLTSAVVKQRAFGTGHG